MLLSPTGPKASSKAMATYRKRFIGRWKNPHAECELVLKDTGECFEAKASGALVATGLWKLADETTAVVALSHNMNARIKVADDNVIAVQLIAADGSLHGDGTVRFRDTYDWESSLDTRQPETAVEAKPYVGSWTHPNLKSNWYAKPDGTWVERRKSGGDGVQGRASETVGRGFLVVLENGFRLRMWPLTGEVLAVITISPRGEMLQDGMVISRE